jgi:hypothetical protein
MEWLASPHPNCEIAWLVQRADMIADAFGERVCIAAFGSTASISPNSDMAEIKEVFRSLIRGAPDCGRRRERRDSLPPIPSIRRLQRSLLGRLTM